MFLNTINKPFIPCSMIYTMLFQGLWMHRFALTLALKENRTASMMDFKDVAARDTYLDHPEHKKAGAQLVSLLEGGREGLMVFDLDV